MWPFRRQQPAGLDAKFGQVLERYQTALAERTAIISSLRLPPGVIAYKPGEKLRRHEGQSR